MWRRLLFLVCIVEAGALAAILAALVIEPSLSGSPLTPRTRQLCALAALGLMLGSGYAAACWLHDATVSLGAWVKTRRERDPRPPTPAAAGLAELQAEQGPRAGRDRGAA